MTLEIFVRESFTSFQGTGHLSGERQHFVRFAGCSVDCPIRARCDEPSALYRRGAEARSPRQIVDEAVAAVGERGWLHITGGEPTDQSDGLQELVKLARRRGLYVHVQSSGVRRVPVQWDWLTISPKVKKPAQTFGQELVVVDDGSLTDEWLAELKLTTSFWTYYLVPLWGRDARLTAEIAARCGWMLTLQAHKYWGIR